MTALTPKQVAQRYGVSTATVVHWINTEQLKSINVGRSLRKLKPRWKIFPEQLAEFELHRQSGSTPAPPARRKRQADVIEFIK